MTETPQDPFASDQPERDEPPAGQPTEPLAVPPTPQQPYQAPGAYDPPAYQPPAYQPPAYEPPAYRPPTYQQPPASESPYAPRVFGPTQQPADPFVQGSQPWLLAGSEQPQPQDKDRRKQRATRATAVALVAGLLVGAGGVGAIVAITDTDNARPAATSPTPSPTTQATADASGTSDTSGQFREDGSVAEVASQVLPSVVSIRAVATDGSGGEGSGVILNEEGYILTNNHVVVGAVGGGQLTVTLQNGDTGEATIVGRDPVIDVAVIKVEGLDNLEPATLGDSEELVVGDAVLAIGSPLGLQGTVTEGIVSALNRPVVTEQTEDGNEAFVAAVQTDAAINPGNSGGALVNSVGEVIGINSAIASLGRADGGQSGNIGLGFAIPINQANRSAQELIATGEATHALLGTTVGNNEDPTLVGAQLGDITPGGAAEQGGLESGDVVTKIDGKIVQGAEGLIATVRSYAPGDTVTVTYVRDGETSETSVTLGSDAD